MKSNYLTLFIVLLLNTVVLAQSKAPVNIKWGEKEKTKLLVFANDVLHTDGKNFKISTENKEVYTPFYVGGKTEYKTVLEPKNYRIDVYTKDCKRLKTKQIKIEKAYHAEMCKSVVFNNEIYVLMKYYDINGIKNNLAICKLNKESLELQFLKEIMPRHNNKKDRVQKLDASLSISSNSENLLVYYGSYNEDTDKVTYQVHVFDTQLNLTLDKTIHKTLKDISLFGRRELFINNEGTAYFSGYDYDQLEKPYKTYFIAALKKNKENIENVIIKKENRYINDLSFGLDAKDNIIYTGFSSERSGEKKIGALYTILSKDLKTEISNDWKPFNIDLTTISVPEKYHQSFIDSVELRMKGFGNKFLVNPNNGMFCIWENTHYHRTIFSGYNYSNSNFKNFYNTRDNYRHSEKLILSVSNEGKINWIKDVRKRQQTSSLSFSWDYHSSYSAFVKNNELYLFYNDNPFNFNKKNFFDFRIMKNFKTAALIMTKINEEGVLKNHLLFNSKDNKTYPSPNIFTRISNNEIILLNQKPYAPNIGKLTLK